MNTVIDLTTFQSLEDKVRLLEEKIGRLERAQARYQQSPEEFASQCRKRLEALGSPYRVWVKDSAVTKRLANGKVPIYRVRKADPEYFIIAKLTESVGTLSSRESITKRLDELEAKA